MTYEEFLSNQNEETIPIIETLDQIFLTYPNMSRKIRYKIPFYDHKTWICYINPIRKGKGVEVVFLNGKILQSTFPYLEDKGRKLVAGVTVTEVTDEKLESILPVFEESMLL